MRLKLEIRESGLQRMWCLFLVSYCSLDSKGFSLVHILVNMPLLFRLAVLELASEFHIKELCTLGVGRRRISVAPPGSPWVLCTDFLL